MGTQNADMMNVLHASYNDTLDIASCVLVPQEVFPGPFAPVSIPIDTAVPAVGDTIHMVSQSGMLIDELREPLDASGEGQTITVAKRVSIRIGVVTGEYPQDLRHYKWPCFTTSIPAEPGMSGGFATLPREGGTVAACGVVCADTSTPKAHVDYTECGESIVGCAWPALALRMPHAIPSTPETPTYSLYEMMQAGRIDKAVGGIERIKLLEMENGHCTISRH